MGHNKVSASLEDQRDRRVFIRKAHTLHESDITNRSHLTQGNATSSCHAGSKGRADPDLSLMVRGQAVSSVSSRVENPHSPVAGLSGSQSMTNSLTGKQRMGSLGQWLFKQCLDCATQVGNWRGFFLPSHRRKKAMMEASKTSGAGLEDSLEMKQYWGPLIGHGDNGPSAKPLFSTFRVEGHVTSTCLWHACRAVTIGSFLIVMGMTMAVLGE